MFKWSLSLYSKKKSVGRLRYNIAHGQLLASIKYDFSAINIFRNQHKNTPQSYLLSICCGTSRAFSKVMLKLSSRMASVGSVPQQLILTSSLWIWSHIPINHSSTSGKYMLFQRLSYIVILDVFKSKAPKNQ